jgi:BirA family biotin operon repressor/biotin-[acetyl-CoA-carboxylase] ligase
MTLTASTAQLKLTPRPVRYYEQVDSTNDIALEWLREGAEAGSVVIADEQVKGRGRLGRNWYTPPGTAVILSVILRPKAEYVSRITMLGALAVCEMVQQVPTSLYTSQPEKWEIGIKWPNDVWLNGRKVSGVLSEAVWEGSELQGVVLGVGVNVRINFEGTEMAEGAISIETALGKRVERLPLIAELLAQVDDWNERLGEPVLFDAWRNRLNMLGKKVTVQEGTINGRAEDVDAGGALLVRDGTGKVHRVAAGDIALGS